MNDIVFQRQNGGLARRLPGEDHYSGLLIYSDDLPTGDAFSVDNRVVQIFDINDAEDKGIVTEPVAEVLPTGGNILITAAGVQGNIHTVMIDSTLLGNYVVVLNDTPSLVASGLRAAINAGTSVHGYVAGGTGANVDLTAPAGVGSSINDGNHLQHATNGTGAATVTQFSGGIDEYAEFAVLHYHIKEFFRINPGGVLYVGIFEIPAAYDFAEIDTMQRAVKGKLRQLAVYLGSEPFDVDHLASIQEILEGLDSDHMPLSTVYAADVSSSLMGALPDLKALEHEHVSVCLGQDGGNDGAQLFSDYGWSITCLGACLGAISKASVHECIGWVSKFNMASVELDVPAFCDGTLVSSMSDNELDAINALGYIFLRKFVGKSGSYFNDSHTATAATSDFAYIENNRTMDKAIRGVYTYLLPQVNGPVYVGEDGKLAPETVTSIEQMGQRALEEMERAGELSGYKVVIDPDQDILSTSVLNVTIAQIPVGVSRNITIKIGYVQSVQ